MQTEFKSMSSRRVIHMVAIMKSTETYLENSYKFQCSYYYGKSENPFNSLLHKDSYEKCLINYCYIKHKCFIEDHLFVIRQFDKFNIDSNFICTENHSRDCLNDKVEENVKLFVWLIVSKKYIIQCTKMKYIYMKKILMKELSISPGIQRNWSFHMKKHQILWY